MVHRQLKVLPLTPVLEGDKGRILRSVLQLLGLPNGFAGLLVQRDDGALGATWSAEDLVAIHQHGLGITPRRWLATKFLHRPVPKNFSIGHVRANQCASAAHG